MKKFLQDNWVLWVLLITISIAGVKIWFFPNKPPKRKAYVTLVIQESSNTAPVKITIDLNDWFIVNSNEVRKMLEQRPAK